MKSVAEISDIDTEVVALCDAINQCKGLRTFLSCAGHGKSEFSIWLTADFFDALVPLAYAAAWCHCGVRGWDLVAKTDCGMSPITFWLRGPISGKGAQEIAEALNELK